MSAQEVEMVPRCLDRNHQPRWQYAHSLSQHDVHSAWHRLCNTSSYDKRVPRPVSLLFPSKRPPATKALKDVWQRGDESHKLPRHCWFWGCVALRVSSHVGCFSGCNRSISALCYHASTSRSQNRCVASTVVTSAAKPSALPGFNLPILFPESNRKGPSSGRTVLFSLHYCFFCSRIFPWCFPGAVHLRHNTKACSAMCSPLIIIDWCWKECCM